MKRTHTQLSIAAIVVITIISGVVQGTLSGRWGPSVDLAAAGQALASFPQKFGDWEMQMEQEVDEQVQKMLRSTGNLHRTYANSQTGQVVNLAMIVGPPGPTSVHVPEICFSSQAYTQDGDRKRIHIAAADDSRDGEFWALTFRPNDLNSVPMSVYYAWSNGHRWEAVDNPRVSHGGAKILYKLQLAGDIGQTMSGQGSPTNPCRSFLESMLAESGLPGTSN